MTESKEPLKRKQCILEVRPFKIWRPNSSVERALAEQAQEPDFRARDQAQQHVPKAPGLWGGQGKADRSWRLPGLTKLAQMARSRFSGKQCLRNKQQKGSEQWRKAAGADL